MSKRAVLFPGQGAQYVGMGKDLAERNQACADLFKRAGDALGFDLAQIAFEGPIERLTKSAHAQPAIFIHSLCCWQLYRAKNPSVTFSASAGLSSGEWTALHVAGVVSFEDTLKVLEARGRFMQLACETTPGGMLTIIGAEQALMEKICAETGIQMANLNSHEQTVLSGSLAGIDAAVGLAKAAGLKKVIKLNVAGAFHSELMRPAADQMREVIAQIPFHAPSMPVLSMVTAKPHGSPDEIKARMVEQIYSSLHWYESIEWMMGQDIHHYLELGPGKVLTGLVKRIDKSSVLTSIQDNAGLDAVVAS